MQPPRRFRRCRCGQSWGFHSAADAAASLSVSVMVFHRMRRDAQVGRMICGKWHFRRSDLAKLQRRKPGPPRTVAYTTEQERQRYYYLRDLERNREKRRLYGNTYYHQYRGRIIAKRRLRYAGLEDARAAR